MNELTKTSIFIAIAVVLLLFAWLVQPRDRSVRNDNDMIGRQLLENFKDPSEIKELQIVKFVPETGDQADFRVAEVNGKWCLPSHQNYPADADDQMGRVASDFVDQKVLDIAYRDTGNTDVREMHATYGVLDPESTGSGTGDSVGVKVKFTGENQRILASLIIGKEVEDTGGRHSYVRVPGQNTVYVMAINKNNLSTKFDDWVEKNLLDISSYDLQSVRMQDYSTDMVETDQGIAMAPVFHSYFKVNYDPMALGEKWRLATFQRADERTGQRIDVTLAPEEALNEKMLEDMRQAFDDLKIIDVLRKPESIASAQRAGEVFVKSYDDIETLQNVGYMLHARETQDGMTAIRIYSRQGEAFIDMKDGIVYHLMFGNLTGTNVAGNATAPSADTDGESSADIGGSAATNVLSANRYLMILAEFDESILEKPALVPLTEVPEEGDEEEIARLKQQRESDERSNKQLEDDYADAIETGKRRVQELNLRFADWFFVISDEVFKKIHVTDTDLMTRPGEPQPDPEFDAGLDEMVRPFNDIITLPSNGGIDFPGVPQDDSDDNTEVAIPSAEPEPVTEPEPIVEPIPAEPEPAT
ncbi:MAG: DUF4340 domain-containing protein [Planctomycetaceae bacterium]|nr:DUF4340 domain-containing protein [Planctomycetaceae bacterium]